MFDEEQKYDVATVKAYEAMVHYGIPNLRGRYAQCDLGTISAYRPDRTTEENEKETKKLMKILAGLGYSSTVLACDYYKYFPDREKGGRYPVRMLLVFDKESNYQLCENLVRLGEKFGQEFITYQNVEQKHYKMVGTSYDSEVFAYHAEKKISGIFFTSIGFIPTTHHKRPFIFERIDVADISEFWRYDFNINSVPPEKQEEIRKYAQEFMKL